MTICPASAFASPAAGTTAFIFNYRVRGTGRERRITIGRFPNWTVGAARKEARRLQQMVDQGGDPLGDIEAERNAPTVADLCDRFGEEHLPRKRPGTIQAYRLILAKHIRPHFGAHAKVSEVVFADIDALHRKISRSGAPYAANRTIAVLSKMFSLATRWGMRPDNPVRGIERNYEQKRKRYLSGDELARLTKALAAPDKQFANIIRMLLLTGARRGEVLSMRWADLDLAVGTWTKPASTTKQKADHAVPLSAPARQLLSEIRDERAKKHPNQPLGEFVFPSHRASGHVVDIWPSWVALCKAAGIDRLRIHDLRHSFARQLASSGASLPLIGALLGHSNPTTTHRYSHLFDDPQRAAVERVAAIIDTPGRPPQRPPRHSRRGGVVAAGRKKRRLLSQAAWDDLLKTPGAPTEAELWDSCIELMRATMPNAGELPREVLVRVCNLVQWLLLLKPVTGEQLKLDRWQHVWHGLDQFGDFKLACQWASKKLQGRPADAGPDQMGADYKEMQKTLRKEMRRPRTYKRFRRDEQKKEHYKHDDVLLMAIERRMLTEILESLKRKTATTHDDPIR
jgi:integrase